MNIEHWVGVATGVPVLSWLIQKGWVRISVRLDIGQPRADAPVPLKKPKRKHADR